MAALACNRAAKDCNEEGAVEAAAGSLLRGLTVAIITGSRETAVAVAVNYLRATADIMRRAIKEDRAAHVANIAQGIDLRGDPVAVKG
eukprot:6168370-Lingulodinium_polyedra.AAC.1